MEFSLHLLSLIILCGIATGSILAMQLWLFPWGNRRANHALSLLLLNYIVLAVAFVFYLEYSERSVKYHAIFSLQLLIGPLIYFYTRLLTEADFRWQKHHLWHCLPALLTALLWQLQLPINEDGVLNLACINTEGCDLLYRSRFVHRISAYASLSIYAITSLLLLKPHLQRIKQHYSSLEEVNLNWLNILISFQLITILLAIGLEIRSLFIHDLWTPGLLMSLSPVLMTLLMGWFGLQQRNIQLAEQTSPEVEDQNLIASPLMDTSGKKYQTSSLSTDRGEAIWRLLQRTMEQDQPYLEPGLKIADLANQMEVPSHHLSEVLNGYTQQSFYDFINYYRVKEAARLLRDPQQQHLSVTDIGLQAGFNSNSTFFAHFKKRQQQTPKKYRQQYQSQT